MTSHEGRIERRAKARMVKVSIEVIRKFGMCLFLYCHYETFAREGPIRTNIVRPTEGEVRDQECTAKEDAESTNRTGRKADDG